MTARAVDHLSWWCDHPMTWDEFHDAVQEHVQIWKLMKPKSLDFVGAQMQRDLWEPRRDPTPRRYESPTR